MTPPKIKEVVCSICGNKVTKRQTLAFGTAGRACREHDEVKQLIGDQERMKEEKSKREEKDKISREAQEALEVLMGVSSVRVCQKQSGAPMGLVMEAMARRLNMSDRVKEKVWQEVEKAGVMTDEEVTESITTYLHFMMEAQKSGHAGQETPSGLS